MIFEQNIVKINEGDNVAVATESITAGDVVFGVKSTDTIPAGHKIALCDFGVGDDVVKYGFSIGKATKTIPKGGHVHTHNIKTNLSGLGEYAYNPVSFAQKPPRDTTFMGFDRGDGKVGIRNEVWIIPTVGCVNKTAERLAASMERCEGIDGVYAYAHPYGCSQLGEDHSYTEKILAGLVNHPNAAGVLVLGLGCENNLIETFKETIGEYDPRRVKFLNTQDVSDELEEGRKLLNDIFSYASAFRRKPIPIGKLIIGLKCGGSDGLSGITANTLVGCLTDVLISSGGTCILTEVPEMFGAETLLMDRAVDEVVFRKTVELINDFKAYFIRHKQVIYENPSPGNKEGGISTLEDKSLGCTQKGGVSPVVDVLDYGGRVVKPGLNLLQGPGNDIVAVTNLTAAGAHIVLFTTGRGTPLGAPVPTVKISSNTNLAAGKPHWIDFDAGVLVDGKVGVGMEELTDKFLEFILSVAEGKTLAKNEIHGYREISIFRDGVTL